MSGALEIALPLAPYALLLLRLWAGLGLLVGRGVEQFVRKRRATVEIWKNHGVPGLLTSSAAALNFFGGLFLIVGLVVPISAALLGIEMIATVYIQKRILKSVYFGHRGHGYEINLAYLSILGVLVVFGGGAISIDSLLGF